MIMILISVMFRFERPFNSHADIVGLFLCEFCELHTYFRQVQARDLFIKVLWQTLNADFVWICPKFKLCKCLISK